MKKLIKVFLAIMMIVVLLTLPTFALADAGGSSPATDIASLPDALINYGLQVAATLLITLIGALGTYLSLQLGKNAKLKNINDAQKELIRAAKITVGELQQTVVSGVKAVREDGKLLPGEIEALNKALLSKTLEKLSAPAYSLLSAAAVDVDALILGVGESWIDKIKQQSNASGNLDE